MSERAPHWAYARACELTGFAVPTDYVRKATYGPALESFARYIAEHEEAPVDPLLIEARQMAANDAKLHGNSSLAKAFLIGECDEYTIVAIALAALRRGIELGSAK